ncbi:MAG: tRNA uracil 4-sulfurtransferase ThiI [Longimicrobiales bacterium]
MVEKRQEHLALVRFGGELFIKSKRTRAAFIRRLVRNLEDAVAGLSGDASVERGWDRLFVHADDASVYPTVARVFGVSSISRVEAVTPATVADILAAGEAFIERVRGRTFAIRARRAGEHDFSSQDVQVELGNLLLDASAGVDLDAPEVEVFVEVRNERAYLFAEKMVGARGLPLGVEGKAVTLLSGGFDSAVAAWLMLKRGITQDYVFCNLGGDAYERAVVQVGKVLADSWSYGTRPRLHVVDFAGPLDELRSHVKAKYWQVVLKRLMYRAASAVGAEIGAEAIITGEAVGQVSSQTLTNLRAIEPAAALPLFRPLLGFDKEEIIERARAVGTAVLSEQVKEYCAIAPGRPVTSASVSAVAGEERKVDLSVVDHAVADRKVLALRDLTPTDLVAPYLFTEEVPDHAVVLDCRPESAYRHWHLPGAERKDEWELLRRYGSLDRDAHYVLYCGHGIQSAHIAERMQQAGYEAYSFRGGVKALKEWAE